MRRQFKERKRHQEPRANTANRDLEEQAETRNDAIHAPPSAAGQFSSQPNPAAILYLQRTAGNQAVRRMLAQRDRQSAPQARPGVESRISADNLATDVPIIRRFVSSEHRSLGDLNADETPVDFPEGALFPNSPALSYGEIVALSGDFYGSFDNLVNPNYINAEGREVPNSAAQKISEINQLKRLFQVEAEIRATGREPEGLDMGNVEHNGESLEGFDKTTGGRYLALAEANFPHFTVSDHNNISSWMEGHTQALTEAYQAGTVGDMRKKMLAVARNAASNHFLTDAFAAGHMRVPRSDIDRYYRDLMAGVVPGLRDAILDELPEEIGVTLDLRPFVPDIVEEIPGVSRYLRHRFSVEIRSKVASYIDSYVPQFTAFMRDEVGPKLGGLVSKWLHDTDNENGLLVTNEAGGRWRAYGDAALDHPQPADSSINTTNRTEAQKAVEADRTEVEEAYALGEQNATGENESEEQEQAAGLIPDSVYFDFDKPKHENDFSALNASGIAQLNNLAQYLTSVEGVTVNLEGWADSRGSRAYNEGLAMRRISAVQAYLLSAGVPADRIGAPNPQGEPLVETTAGNHHMFRRVDISLEGTPTRPKPEPGQTPESSEFEMPHPFAAEQYLPHVEEEGNDAMQPYEWCNLDQAQKDALRSGLKPIVIGGARDMLQAAVEDSLPENYHVEFTIPNPIPLMDDFHIDEDIPVQDIAMEYATPVINKALNAALSDTVFGNLMDGACSLSD